jgi:hypothetical protein
MPHTHYGRTGRPARARRVVPEAARAARARMVVPTPARARLMAGREARGIVPVIRAPQTHALARVAARRAAAAAPHAEVRPKRRVR